MAGHLAQAKWTIKPLLAAEAAQLAGRPSKGQEPGSKVRVVKTLNQEDELSSWVLNQGTKSEIVSKKWNVHVGKAEYCTYFHCVTTLNPSIYISVRVSCVFYVFSSNFRLLKLRAELFGTVVHKLKVRKDSAASKKVFSRSCFLILSRFKTWEKAFSALP